MQGQKMGSGNEDKVIKDCTICNGQPWNGKSMPEMLRKNHFEKEIN